jgi:hypothetical protein
VDQWQELSSRTKQVDANRNIGFGGGKQVEQKNDFFNLPPRETKKIAPPPTSIPVPSSLIQKVKKDPSPIPIRHDQLPYSTSPQLGNAIWSPPSDQFSPATPSKLTPPSFFLRRTPSDTPPISTSPVVGMPPMGNAYGQSPPVPGNYFSVDDIESQLLGMQIKMQPQQPVQMPIGTPPQPFSMPYPQPNRETPPPTEQSQQSNAAPYRKYLYYTYNTYNPKQIDATYNQINRRLFEDSDFMNAEEIEQIVRQQMSDLQIHNPFLDDYYYCSITNKKAITQKRINANFANWVVESLSIYKSEEELEAARQKEKEELAQLPRVFGRIPSQNVRAPRTIFEFEKDVKAQMSQVSSASTLNRNPNVNLSVMIENGMNIVMQIQEHALCQRQTSSNYSANQKLREEFFELCNMVMNSIVDEDGSRLFQIISRRKGVKFVSKALRHMPDIFTMPILVPVFLNWKTIFNDEMWVQFEPELRDQFADGVSEAILSFNNIDSLCQLLLRNNGQRNNDPSYNAQTEVIDFDGRTFQTEEAARIFAALLNRVYELRKKNRNANMNTWSQIYDLLFERSRGHFTAIVTKTQMGWELATAFLRQSNNVQKPILIGELRQFLARNDIEAMKSFYAVLTHG